MKNTLSLLKEYHHVVVYLSGAGSLKNEFEGDVEFICLNHTGWYKLFNTMRKLKLIIKQKDPILVHSHLFASTVVARLATPKAVPLFTTLHSIFSVDAFQKNIKSLWVEKLTLKKKHTLIAVSKFVLDDYLKFVPFNGKNFVLYNFVPDNFFEWQSNIAPAKKLKCIAVGNLKEAKNYSYLLDIFSNLKNTGISLDIYGEGAIKEQLQKRIDENNLPVRFLGKVSNIKDLFKNYHVFVQASFHEGFGISVIEAMATKLPVLISDIPVFKEITSGHAHFFTLNNSKKASEIFCNLFENTAERVKHVDAAFNYCYEHYSSTNYKQKLLSIYNSCFI